jgi:hypothetical protein
MTRRCTSSYIQRRRNVSEIQILAFENPCLHRTLESSTHLVLYLRCNFSKKPLSDAPTPCWLFRRHWCSQLAEICHVEHFTIRESIFDEIINTKQLTFCRYSPVQGKWWSFDSFLFRLYCNQIRGEIEMLICLSTSAKQLLRETLTS